MGTKEGHQRFQQPEGALGHFSFPSFGSPQTLLSTYSVPWEHIGENAKETGRWNQKQKERLHGCNTAKLSEPADLPKAGDSSFILS